MKQGLNTTINEYLPLRDVVFQTLRQAILKGELEPGERLMEIHLAKRLGVSRTPIREAIRKLELEGLVVMIPRRGAVVASITEKDMRDVLQVRKTLEVMAVEVACGSMNDEDMKKLQEACETFSKSLTTQDAVRMAQADMGFHEIIYGATGNQKLIGILSNLREQMFRYRLEYLKDPDSYERVEKEHNRICRGICEKDKDRACQAMREHIDNQEARIIRAIRENQ
ncbi:MAG: GntR family transcriptional regulator [Lachnospiraceae bacterium]|nr:GntR family transcriptional regulator [Lachnospiraceae bacterium]